MTEIINFFFCLHELPGINLNLLLQEKPEQTKSHQLHHILQNIQMLLYKYSQRHKATPKRLPSWRADTSMNTIFSEKYFLS